MKFDALRPFLAHQYVFVNDDNNIPQYSLDDYFTLGMYEGEIYKTRNLKNLSMAQMYPDEDMRKQAQDSIDNRLRNYGAESLGANKRGISRPEREGRGAYEVNRIRDTIPEGQWWLSQRL